MVSGELRAKLLGGAVSVLSTHSITEPPVWRAPEGPEGLAAVPAGRWRGLPAVPAGGGGAWPG